MFRVLDTNHFTALVAGGALSLQIDRRAVETDADLFTSIVTAQEVMQGWLAALNRERATITPRLLTRVEIVRPAQALRGL